MNSRANDTPTAAAALRARGFALCKPDPVKKKPTYPGWSARSLEQADFAPGDQLGILAGPLSHGNKHGHALVQLDLDSGEALDHADDRLPETGMVEGREGKPRSHRGYLVPLTTIPAWAFSTAEQGAAAAKDQFDHPGPATRSFRHTETRAEVLRFVGTGGQCVCPPSFHRSGERREWEGGEPATVAFLDLWLAVCRLAQACSCVMPAGLSWPWEPPPPLYSATRTRLAHDDHEKVVRRAIKYLEKMPLAVSGQDGHGMTLTAARVSCWGFDLGEDIGFRVLRDHYNPLCSPSWSDVELRHKCRDATHLEFDKPRGYLRDTESPTRTGRAHVRSRDGAFRTTTAVAALTVSGELGDGGTSIAVLDDDDFHPNDEPECGCNYHDDRGRSDGYLPPQTGERWDDPHRLARLYLDDRRTSDRLSKLVQYRSEYQRWDGAAWLPVPDGDLNADLAHHCRAVYEGDYPARVELARSAGEDSGGEKPAKKPAIFTVTSTVRSNVRTNLAGLANVPDRGADPPFWLAGGENCSACQKSGWSSITDDGKRLHCRQSSTHPTLR